MGGPSRFVAAVASIALLSCSGNPRPEPRPVEPDPCGDARARLQAADEQLAEGYLHHALEAGRQLTQSCPSSGADHLVARALSELGLDDEAIEAYRRWSQSDPDRAAAARAAIARIERRPPARKEASRDDQQRALALYRDGVGLRIAGQYEQSIRQLRRSYYAWPHPLTIVQIALTHRAAGDEIAYRKASERALAIAEKLEGARAEPEILTGNVGGPRSLAFSPDGRHLAAIDELGQVNVWDLTAGRQSLGLRPTPADPNDPDDRAHELAFSPSGDLLAAVGTKQPIMLWSPETGRPVGSVGAPATRYGLAFARDGRLWTHGANRALQLHDLQTGQATEANIGTGRTVYRLAPSGEIALLTDRSADRAGSMLLWDLRGGVQRAELPATGMSQIAAFSHEGDRLAIVGIDDTIRVFDGRTGSMVRQWKEEDAYPRALAYQDGRLAMMGSNDRTLLWKDGRKTAVIASPGGQELAWNHDASILAVGLESGVIRLFDPDTGTLLRALTGNVNIPLRAALSPDGASLSIGNVGGDVVVHDLAGEGSARIVHDGDEPAFGLAHHPQRPELAIAEQDKPIALLDLATGQRTELAVGGEEVTYFGGGRYLAVGRPRHLPGQDRAAQFWNLSVSPPRPLDTATSFRIMATTARATVVAAVDGGRVRLLDLEGKKLLGTLDSKGSRFEAMAMSADGRWLVLPRENGKVELWDTTTKKLSRVLRDEGAPSVAVGFAPDGSSIAVGDTAGGLAVFDVASGRLLHRTQGHQGFVVWVGFTAGGLLVTSGVDGTVGLWRPRRGELVARLASDPAGRWLVMAPDGRVDGSEASAELLTWQVGDIRLPGFVGWSRQRAPGLLRRLLAE